MEKPAVSSMGHVLGAHSQAESAVPLAGDTDPGAQAAHFPEKGPTTITRSAKGSVTKQIPLPLPCWVHLPTGVQEEYAGRGMPTASPSPDPRRECEATSVHTSGLDTLTKALRPKGTGLSNLRAP